MSFADLRKARNARQAGLVKTTVPTPSKASESQQEHESVIQSKETSEPYAVESGLYSALASSFEIRVDSSTGRGIYVKQGLSTVTAVKAGSIILEIVPQVSVLSTRSLASHCSYCHAEDGTSSGTLNTLKRCTLCKVVWYDTTACQNKDWPIHKSECTALRKWAEAARQAGVGSSDTDVTLVPSDAVRALGRILWTLEREGLSSTTHREFKEMQSHRTSLGPKSPSHTVLTSLGHSLARYMGNASDQSGFTKWGISSAAELVDLLSKFTTNSFTLATPSLSPIGVCVSPLAALINHSCAPNSAVVFPRTIASSPTPLVVVALRDLKPGEQVLNSYVDITLPTTLRRRELQETYMFECTCVTCVQTSPDPRSSFRCRTCEALTAFELPASKAASNEDEDKPTVCQCQAKLAPNTGEFLDALSVGLEALGKANKLQFSDPMKALKYTASSLALLQPYPLHLSSHPLLALTRLHLSLSLSSLSSIISESKEAASLEDQRTRDSLVDDASRTAARCVAGVSGVPGMTEGHPVRGIALAELGKLLCVDVDSSPPSPLNTRQIARTDEIDQDQDDVNVALPRGVERLQLAAQILKRARDEFLIGFGKEGGGGDVGRAVDTMLRDLEREVNVWDKATRSGSATVR